ncbi:MAG: 2OG-Fe(II) oxygenase family protein, partial [Alphaproteobacteria bacterium]
GELMQMLAMGLGLPSDHFEILFGKERMSLTKLIRYPATPPGQFGVNAHHDAGFLTVLAPGETRGLEVENAAGEWIPVPIIPDTLVINLGEILQAMSGNYFIATPHRVVTNQPRQSVGYFHGSALDVPLKPLDLDRRFVEAVAASPRHASAGFMAQRDETDAGIGDMRSPHHPDTYGGQLWNYFSRSYPDNVQRHYPATQTG